MVLKRLKKTALQIKKGWQSDANPIQKGLNKASGTGSKKTAGGRIQKNLIDKGGAQASDLRRKKEAHKASQKKRSEMQKLRKTDPEKYKKLKKKERKAANIKAFTSRSSTWD